MSPGAAAGSTFLEQEQQSAALAPGFIVTAARAPGLLNIYTSTFFGTRAGDSNHLCNTLHGAHIFQ